MDSRVAYQYLSNYGGIDFLMQHYDIEHTLSLDDAIDDLEKICRDSGVCAEIFATGGGLIMDKVRALIEGVTQDVIAYLVEDENISIKNAMDATYSSEVFNKLSDTETGLYRESPAYVATLLKDEIANGKLVQMEV